MVLGNLICQAFLSIHTCSTWRSGDLQIGTVWYCTSRWPSCFPVSDVAHGDSVRVFLCNSALDSTIIQYGALAQISFQRIPRHRSRLAYPTFPCRPMGVHARLGSKKSEMVGRLLLGAALPRHQKDAVSDCSHTLHAESPRVDQRYREHEPQHHTFSKTSPRIGRLPFSLWRRHSRLSKQLFRRTKKYTACCQRLTARRPGYHLPHVVSLDLHHRASRWCESRESS